MHIQDGFNINKHPNFNFKFPNFVDSKTLSNVIIFVAGRIGV